MTPDELTVETTSLLGHGRILIDVEVFTRDEACRYLNAVLASQPHLQDGLGQVAEALGYLPLALAQASAYMLDRNVSCDDYLMRWQDRRRTVATLVPDPDGLPDDHRTTVAVTWSLSVEQANCLAPAGVARPLLEAASFLDANGVPDNVFTAPAVMELVSDVVGHEVSTEDIRDGLTCLRRLSLVILDPNSSAQSIRVHGLVQRVTRDDISADRLPVTVRAVADALVHVWPSVERDTLLTEVLRANALALTDTGGTHLWTPDAHGVWFRAGRSLSKAGLVVEARDYFLRMQDAALDRLGADHRDTLSVRSELAALQDELGDIEAAIGYVNDLLADCMRVLGADDPDTLSARAHLAALYGRLGEIDRATFDFEDLLDDYLRLLGPDHRDTLRVRNHLAFLCGRANDVDGAVMAYEELLADYVRVLGPDDPDTLITRNNLAHARGKAGDTAGAVAACEELLIDVFRVFGPGHPDTLGIRGNLARWRSETGDMTGSTAAYEELLADRRRVLGPDHIATLATRGNLAYLRSQSGNVDAASADFEELLTDYLRVLGPDHFYTLDTAGALYWQKRIRRDPP